jgi:3-hydroxymyristoyl/3-hydroxydecanoyl-(acyl carrier protein) dehydratase
MTTQLKSALFTTEQAQNLDGSLFCQVSWQAGDKHIANFAINAKASLLGEHFPSFAVVPASLIIGFVKSLALSAGRLQGNLSLANIRFNQPMVPGSEYACQFEQRGARLMFTITNSDATLITKGLLSSSENTKSGEQHAA